MVEEHDEAKGLEMLEQLADNGSAIAQYSLVKLYQQARQYKKTGKYLPKLAELPLTAAEAVPRLSFGQIWLRVLLSIL